MEGPCEPKRLLWTAVQAAEALAISPRKLWSLTNSGDVPCVRIGRCVRYVPDELSAWIDQRRTSRTDVTDSRSSRNRASIVTSAA